jgi:hypothetical protein
MNEMRPEREAGAKKGQTVAGEYGQNVSLSRYYEYPPSEPRLNLAYTKYVNGFTGNVSSEDAFIDFIELPGRKIDGIQTIEGCRIYLTHNNVRALYALLGEMIKQVESNSNEGEGDRE